MVKVFHSKLLVVLILFQWIATAGAAERQVAPELSDQHRRWLDEDVVYLISEREREIFLVLETEEERDAFVEAFWRRRDPNPATPQNEFREDYQERLDYVNRYFGYDSPLPGWKSDRGRIYLKLGPPHDVQRFPSDRNLVPTELWF